MTSDVPKLIKLSFLSKTFLSKFSDLNFIVLGIEQLTLGLFEFYTK